MELKDKIQKLKELIAWLDEDLVAEKEIKPIGSARHLPKLPKPPGNTVMKENEDRPRPA